MEKELTVMHKMINSTNEKRLQLESLLASLPAEEKYKALKNSCQLLLHLWKCQ